LSITSTPLDDTLLKNHSQEAPCKPNSPNFQAGSPASIPPKRQAPVEIPGALLLPSAARPLKIPHDRAVIYPRVSQCGFHVLVTQYPLHTENGHASIEQHRRTGMAKLVRRDMKSVLPAHRRQAR
jgi:hypothetical protein